MHLILYDWSFHLHQEVAAFQAEMRGRGVQILMVSFVPGFRCLKNPQSHSYSRGEKGFEVLLLRFVEVGEAHEARGVVEETGFDWNALSFWPLLVDL